MAKIINYNDYIDSPVILKKEDALGGYYAIYDREKRIATTYNLLDAIIVSINVERELYGKYLSRYV